jgi:hypothetical protein
VTTFGSGSGALLRWDGCGDMRAGSLNFGTTPFLCFLSKRTKQRLINYMQLPTPSRYHMLTPVIIRQQRTTPSGPTSRAERSYLGGGKCGLECQMQRRSRIKQTRSFVERLIEHAESVRAKAASLSIGAERDAILEKLEQTERAVEISRWLSSAELQPPRRGS